MRSRNFFAAAAIAMALPIAANAATIFSTFDTGHSYYCCIGWTVSGPSSPIGFLVGDASVANAFHTQRKFDITQIDLGIGRQTAIDNAVVSLWTDVAGLPGAELGSWAISGLPAFGSTTDGITTIGGISGITLGASSKYFIVIDAGAPETWDAWNFNSIGATGLHLLTVNGGAWVARPKDFRGAFDVSGTPVPEPATLTMFGLGLAALGAMRRRKVKAQTA